jgi:hypothetical protein
MTNLFVYPKKLSLKSNGEIKTSQDKHKLKQFNTTKPALHKINKGIQHKEEEERQLQALELRKD